VYQDQTEQQSADDVADVVQKVNLTDAGRFPAGSQHQRRERQQVPRDQAVRRQQHETSDHRLGHAHLRTAQEDDVAQRPQQEQLHDGQDRNQHLRRDQHRHAVAQPGRRFAEIGTQPRQQQPVAQHDPQDKFVAGKHAEQFPHQRDLRQERRDAQRAHGQKQHGALAADGMRRIKDRAVCGIFGGHWE